MKDNWKTLLQVAILSAIIVCLYAFSVIYSLAEQTSPGASGTAEKYLDFAHPLVLESFPGVVLISLWYFCMLTIILYLVIFLVKKVKKSKT